MQNFTYSATSKDWLNAKQIKITLINRSYERGVSISAESFALHTKIVFLPSPQLNNDQSWYWTSEWQRMETEADEDLRTGQYRDFDSIDEMIDFLDSPKEQ